MGVAARPGRGDAQEPGGGPELSGDGPVCSGAASKPIHVSGLLLMFSHFQLFWMGHSHLHLFHQPRAWAAEAGAVPWPMPGGFCRPWGHKYSRDGGRGAAPARLSAIAGCPAPPAQGTL